MSETTLLGWDESWLERSIAERFGRVTEHFGSHEAVVDEQQRLTYTQLDEWSSNIQQAILHQRGDQPEPVLILAGQTCQAIAAMLGVLKAGKFYSIVDAGQPAEWLTAIAADLRPALILFDEASTNQALRLAARVKSPALALETLLQEQLPVNRVINRRIHPTDLAMVVFTSGTTGQPKGVMVNQRTIMSRGGATLDRGEIFDNARVLLVLSLTFGFGIASIFGALLNGATLVQARGSQLRVEEPAHIIRKEAISSLAAPPSLLRNLLHGLESGREMLNLRYLATGGERLFYDDVVRWQKIIPANTILEYRIGSTETVGAYASLRLDRAALTGEAAIPVGYPPPDVEIVLVDDNMHPVAPGETGQITVRKDFMADGYWQQPELTAQRFLPDPEGGQRRIFLTGDRGYFRQDGCLIFLGRADTMVKIRGFRVELEAIEVALRKLPNVKAAALTAQRLQWGDQRLIAYVVAEPDSPPSATTLRQQLAQSVPDYMVPSRFIYLDALPLTPSGKIDRQALPPPGKARPQLDTPFIAPRTDLEQQLADLWAELLDLDEVGVEDNFFELGGDSLLAMRLVLVVEQRLGWQVQGMFFQSPTISAIGNLIKNIDIQTDDASVHPLNIPQRSNLHPIQPRRSRLPSISVGALLRSAPQKLALRLTYQQGIRWLVWWSNQSFLQERLYNANREMFERFAAAMGTDSSVTKFVFQTALLGDLVRRCYRQVYAQRLPLVWGGPANMLTSPHKFWRSFFELALSTPAERHHDLVVFDGLEHLHCAQGDGRGVILLMYHAAAEFAAISLLERFVVHAPILRINQNVARKLAETDASDLPASTSDKKSAWSSTLLTQGLHILKSGGVVQIVNDHAHDTNNTVPQVIGGRVYAFKTSFAELALETGAAIIPTIICHESNGHLHITCLSSLEPDLSLDRRAGILDLVEQYSRFVAYAWRTQPESVAWGMIQRHFDRPVAK